MSGGDYAFYRRQYSDKTTDLSILAGTDYSASNGTAVVSPKTANHRLYIQKITVNPSTYAAKTWTWQDNAGTPVAFAFDSIPATAPTAGGDCAYVHDFGPKGRALTIGVALLLKMSAAGVAGGVHIEAYEKLDATIASEAGAASQ